MVGAGNGFITPFLLIVAEGILANQHMSELKDEDKTLGGGHQKKTAYE